MKRLCSSSLMRPCCRPSRRHDHITALSFSAPRSGGAGRAATCLPSRNSLLKVQQCRHISSSTSRRSFGTTDASSQPGTTTKGQAEAQAEVEGKRHSGNLLTLAIESSCDDTCVAILERDTGTGAAAAARLHFNDKVTADSRDFKGVYPDLAVRSHVSSMAPLLKRALRALPEASSTSSSTSLSSPPPAPDTAAMAAMTGDKIVWVDGRPRRKPDFVTVTRGPGMMSNLTVGLMTAKSLAVSWDVPLLAVNHMEAHALTPRLVHALEKGESQEGWTSTDREATSEATTTTTTTTATHKPDFPFISVLVSGGHSLLVHSRGLADHAVLAQADNIAIGDLLDKCARLILPESCLAEAKDVMYGRLLEDFAFPRHHPITGNNHDCDDHNYDYEYQPTASRPDEQRIYTSPTAAGWWLTPPMHTSAAMRYDFSGLNGRVKAIVADEHPNGLDVDERRQLARHTMRLAFEHLASRLIMALRRIRKDDELAAIQSCPPSPSASSSSASPDSITTTTTTTPPATDSIKTVVLSGGVASNRYLRHILRSILDVRGFTHVELIYPPIPLCTDNAAMIAWTGVEMYLAGWRSELDVTPLKKWPLDPADEATGGILGVDGWYREGEGSG